MLGKDERMFSMVESGKFTRISTQISKVHPPTLASSFAVLPHWLLYQDNIGGRISMCWEMMFSMVEYQESSPECQPKFQFEKTSITTVMERVVDAPSLTVKTKINMRD